MNFFQLKKIYIKLNKGIDKHIKLGKMSLEEGLKRKKELYDDFQNIKKERNQRIINNFKNIFPTIIDSVSNGIKTIIRK